MMATHRQGPFVERPVVVAEEDYYEAKARREGEMMKAGWDMITWPFRITIVVYRWAVKQWKK